MAKFYPGATREQVYNLGEIQGYSLGLSMLRGYQRQVQAAKEEGRLNGGAAYQLLNSRMNDVARVLELAKADAEKGIRNLKFSRLLERE